MGLILVAWAYKPAEENTSRMEAEAAVLMEEDGVMVEGAVKAVHMEEWDVVKDACRGVVSDGVWELKVVHKVEVMVDVKVALAADACHAMAFPCVKVMWGTDKGEVHIVVETEFVWVVLAVDACPAAVFPSVEVAQGIHRGQVHVVGEMEVVKVALPVDACHVVVFPSVEVVKGVRDGEVRVVVEMEVATAALVADTCHVAAFPGVEVVEGVHGVEGNTVEERHADTWHAAVSHGDEVVDDVCERAGVLYGMEDMDGHERVELEE